MDIVLLHGSNGSSREIEPLAALLRPHCRLLVPDLPGHGGREVPAALTVEAMAADVLRQLDERNLDRVFFYGYSFGAYIALWIARHHPSRVRGICAFACKMEFDRKTVEHWTHLSSPEWSETAASPRPGSTRVRDLEEFHQPQDWRKVLHANRELFFALGRTPALTWQDLEAINVPVLVIGGDADQVVPAAEMAAIAKALRANTLLFRGPAHPVMAAPLQHVVKLSGFWLAGVEKAQAFAEPRSAASLH